MAEYITKINENGNIAVDDNILVKDYLCTAGSKILTGFNPLISAESVVRLENKGYTIKGKTNIGEFGLDFLGETSAYGQTIKDGKLVGAGASLVESEDVKALISVDLNGAPRRASAISNVKFIKPTYGTVSRHGVVACACSGETVGVTAKTTDTLIEVLSVISGHDKKDGTSLDREYEYFAQEKAFKIAIINELKNNSLDSTIEKLIANGCEVKEISIKEINEIATAWQILMSAETCNNISRFDGVKYGLRSENYTDIDDLYVNTRTEGFGFLTKATLIYGSTVLSKNKYNDCYDKSLKIRGVAKEIIKQIFADYNLILCPAYSGKEYSLEELAKNGFEICFDESKYTALASITGLPAMVTNGVQFMSDYFNENALFGVSKILEK